MTIERAEIADEHGRVHVTAHASLVSIKQGADLIRLTLPGARELALDLAHCLNSITQPEDSPLDWTPERRKVLRSAIAKAGGMADMRERGELIGAEAAALWKAAEAWEEMMAMLDQAALAGELKP